MLRGGQVAHQLIYHATALHDTGRETGTRGVYILRRCQGDARGSKSFEVDGLNRIERHDYMTVLIQVEAVERFCRICINALNACKKSIPFTGSYHNNKSLALSLACVLARIVSIGGACHGGRNRERGGKLEQNTQTSQAHPDPTLAENYDHDLKPSSWLSSCEAYTPSAQNTYVRLACMTSKACSVVRACPCC